MKTIKALLVIVLLYISFIGVSYAQNNSDPDTSKYTSPNNNKVSLLSTQRMKFRLDMGAGYIGGSNSGMFTYIAPYLRYSLTPRFKLDVGAVVLTGSGSLFNNEFSNYSNTNFLLYAKGNYLLTDKLTITGSAYKVFYPNSVLTSDFTNKYSTEHYGYSLGMEYKITKRCSFGAQIIMNKGLFNNNPFQTQPSLFNNYQSNNIPYSFFGW